MNSPRSRFLWLVVGLAFLLRFSQACLRWDEIALAYAAYQQPFVDAIGGGELSAWSHFHGLHPPLYSLCFGLLNALWGAPGAWLLFSAIVSTAAVWVVGRMAGVAAAAILAVDPLQIAYAGEVNNYPLLVLMVALVVWSADKAQKGEGEKALIVCGVLASWTHFLGGLVFGLCGLRLLIQDRKRGIRVLGVGLVCALPVLFRMLQLAGESGSYGQSGLDWGLVCAGLVEKTGWWWMILLPAAVGAKRHSRPLGWISLALIGVILGLVALQIAAPHQQPYWLVLGPFLAILVAAKPGSFALVACWFGVLYRRPWAVASSGFSSPGTPEGSWH